VRDVPCPASPQKTARDWGSRLRPDAASRVAAPTLHFFTTFPQARKPRGTVRRLTRFEGNQRMAPRTLSVGLIGRTLPRFA